MILVCALVLDIVNSLWRANHKTAKQAEATAQAEAMAHAEAAHPAHAEDSTQKVHKKKRKKKVKRGNSQLGEWDG